jgi:homoserine kinase
MDRSSDRLSGDREVAEADVASAFAPASIGNVAVGYDALGCVFPAVGDRIHIRRTHTPTVRIESITGVVTDLPRDPVKNTATKGLLQLIDERALSFGFALTIEKGVPLGSGMGGSAASAVAAIQAASQLLDVPLARDAMFRYALQGEAVASGALHGDNVAPSLYGGLVLTRALDPPDVIPIPIPERIRCVLVRPHMEIETRAARRVVPDAVPLGTTVQHSANLAGFIAGCFQGDLGLIRRSFDDVLVEPHRAHLIPGFRSVQEAARSAGALGCSIAGAGPSLFAWCHGPDTADRVQAAMVEAFADAGMETDAWTTDLGETVP